VTGTISFDDKGDVKNGALTLYTYKAGKRDMLSVVR
jgi:branched-chain amino acid transport system substrate-binding protein